jgi:hypothetical protein
MPTAPGRQLVAAKRTTPVRRITWGAKAPPKPVALKPKAHPGPARVNGTGVSSVVHLSSPAGNITLTPPSFLPSIQSLIPRGVAATPEALQEAASKRLSMLSEGSAVFTSGGMKGQRVSQAYLDQVLGQNVGDFVRSLGSGSRSAASQAAAASAVGGASAVGVAFGGGYHPSGGGGQPLHYSPTRTSNPTSGDTVAPVDFGASGPGLGWVSIPDYSGVNDLGHIPPDPSQTEWFTLPVQYTPGLVSPGSLPLGFGGFDYNPDDFSSWPGGG